MLGRVVVDAGVFGIYLGQMEFKNDQMKATSITNYASRQAIKNSKSRSCHSSCLSRINVVWIVGDRENFYDTFLLQISYLNFSICQGLGIVFTENMFVSTEFEYLNLRPTNHRK